MPLWLTCLYLAHRPSILVDAATSSFADDIASAVVQVPLYDMYKISLDHAQRQVPPIAKVTSSLGKHELNIVAVSIQDVQNGSAVGNPFWQFRIAFVKLGLNQVQFRDGQTHEPFAQVLNFNVTAPHDAQGFVRAGPSGRFFIGSDGSPFIPLGLNIAWPVNEYHEVVSYYESYFQRLAAKGGNFARIWLGPNIVNTPKYKPNSWPMLALLRNGFDRIDAAKASLVDGVLEAAQKYNVRLLVVLESFNTLCPNFASGDCWWETSVYNAKNGGPLKGPLGFLGFWSSSRIIEAWTSYIDYVAHRWGAYRSVFAWQLFNEVDAAMYDVLPAAYTWHHTMVSRFRASDPYLHLLSESWGLALGNPILDHGNLFDFTTTHEYPRKGRGNQDLGSAIMQLISGKIALYEKPALLGEFGCDDTHGGLLTAEAVHQGVWIPTFAGGAGSGMAWWWDNAEVEKAVLSNIGMLRQFLDLANQRLGRSKGLGGYRWSALRLGNLPATVIATGTYGTPLGISDPAPYAAMLLLRAAAWSRPCEANVSSLAVPGFTLTLPLKGSADSWRVEWMCTATGHVVEGHVSAGPAGLQLDVSPFERDVVLLLSRSVTDLQDEMDLHVSNTLLV